MEAQTIISLTGELAAQYIARRGQTEARLSEAERVYRAMMKLHETIGDSFGVQMELPESEGGMGLLLSQSITRPHTPGFYDTSTEHYYGIIVTPKGVYESLGFGRGYARIRAENIPLADRYATIRDNSGASLASFSGTDAELEAVVRQSADVVAVK